MNGHEICLIWMEFRFLMEKGRNMFDRNFVNELMVMMTEMDAKKAHFLGFARSFAQGWRLYIGKFECVRPSPEWHGLHGLASHHQGSSWKLSGSKTSGPTKCVYMKVFGFFWKVCFWMFLVVDWLCQCLQVFMIYVCFCCSRPMCFGVHSEVRNALWSYSLLARTVTTRTPWPLLLFTHVARRRLWRCMST